MIKRKPGRPALSDEPKDTIRCEVPTKLKQKFIKYCDKRGRSMASVLTEIIEKVVKSEREP